MLFNGQPYDKDVCVCVSVLCTCTTYRVLQPVAVRFGEHHDFVQGLGEHARGLVAQQAAHLRGGTHLSEEEKTSLRKRHVNKVREQGREKINNEVSGVWLSANITKKLN